MEQPTSSTNQVINNRYELQTLIGRGGMGVVYKAYDRLTASTVALKQVTIPKDKLEIVTQAPATQDHNLILSNEFSTLASLRHPNIISVLDYGFDDDNAPFFTMTYLHDSLPVTDFADELERAEKVKYLLDILQALRYLHQRGILHRDLKPANILVANNVPKVLDFGLALDSNYQKDKGVAVGTIAYIAPEILHGVPPSTRSDLYSFAVLAHELLTGKHPFPSDSQSDLLQKVLLESPEISTDNLDDAIGAVILRLLSKSPEDRYPNAMATMRALSDAAGGALPAESIEIQDSILMASTFVGRDQELSQLHTALDKSIQGEGQAWLIGGESGVGKTRLMAELRTYALVHGMRTMRGQAVAEGGVSFKIWRDVLPYLILMNDLSDEEATVLSAILPNLDVLLGREVNKKNIDNAALQLRLPLLLNKLLISASEKAPLLILLEDLQWATESIDILQAILRVVPKNRIMVIANYRSDEAPHLSDTLDDMQHIKLDRLTSKEIKRLSGAMLGEVGSSRAVVDLIQRESEGNAFFIVEVVRALAQQAGQLDDIGRVTLPPQVFSGGIQTIIQRRLDRLPDWTIHPIQIAAVAGRQINIPVLKHILPELDIDGWITACNEAAVIMPSSDDWLFAHDKIREHIQSNLIPKQNRDINKQVAEALEYTHADDLQQYAVVLAGHYQAAEDDVKEGNFAILAAKTLKDFFPPQALTFVDRALELEAYKHDAQSAHEEARLYLARGELLIRVNRYDDAYQSLMTAHEKYEALEDELGIARTDCVIGEWGLKVSKLKEAVPRLQNALTVLEKYEDWLQVGYAHMNIGVVYNYLGEVQKMKAHFEACYKVMREHGDPVSYAKSLNNLGNIEDMTGNQDRAEELHKEALGIRQRIKDYRGMGSSYMNLSFVAGEREQPHVQREYLLKALDNMRIVGDKANEANVLDALGKTERKLGNEMQALSYFEEALTLIEPLGAPRLHSTILFDLVRYYQTIDTQKSLTYLQQIVELLENMDHFWTRVGYILYGVDTLVQARVTDTRLVTWFATTLENREAYVGRNYITEVEDRLQEIFGKQIYEMAKVAGQNLTVEKAVTDLQAYIGSYLQKLEQENGK